MHSGRYRIQIHTLAQRVRQSLFGDTTFGLCVQIELVPVVEASSRGGVRD